MNRSRYLECPCCYAEVELEEDEQVVECGECHATLELDPDTEVIDGTWFDRSSLKEVR